MNNPDRGYARLGIIGFAFILSAILITVVSSFIKWRTPALGILIWGHRTNVFLGILSLVLLGSSLIAGSREKRGRIRRTCTGMLLAVSVILFFSVCSNGICVIQPGFICGYLLMSDGLCADISNRE